MELRYIVVSKKDGALAFGVFLLLISLSIITSEQYYYPESVNNQFKKGKKACRIKEGS